MRRYILKINIIKKQNLKLKNSEINIIIEYLNDNEQITQLEKHILEYSQGPNIIYANINNEYVPINKKDIIIFYSDKKYNYCKTSSNSYRIKNKLYQIEKTSKDYIRISKSCIANIKHIKCFDLSQTGKIIVKFDDNTQEIVSRRKAREVLNYLSERGI